MGTHGAGLGGFVISLDGRTDREDLQEVQSTQRALTRRLRIRLPKKPSSLGQKQTEMNVMNFIQFDFADAIVDQ